MECGLRPDALAGLLRCSQFQQDTGTLVGLAVGSTTQILASLQPARARSWGAWGPPGVMQHPRGKAACSRVDVSACGLPPNPTSRPAGARPVRAKRAPKVARAGLHQAGTHSW